MRLAAIVLLLAETTSYAETRSLVRVPMRDGVRLSTNVFVPGGAGPFSAILIRTPYGKGQDLIASYKPFIEQKYAIVVQDVRGRYDSEGVFRPLTQETPDGEDTIRWIARQPWSDGQVVMLGGSYVGIAQWRAALSGVPNLKAIFPVVAGCDEYSDRYYSRGGALKLGHRLSWIAENVKAPAFQPRSLTDYVRALPIRLADQAATGRTVDYWQEALNHPTYDAFWRVRSSREKIAQMHVPAFIVGGWYDNYVESDLECFSALRRLSAAHHAVIGPWGHNMSTPYTSGISFGPDRFVATRKIQLDWFHYWLRAPHPAPALPYAPLRIFVMGINAWRNEQEWPLARTRYVAYYFGSHSGANSLHGDGSLSQQIGREGTDQFIFDPRDPVPTQGGAVCCNPKLFPWGPMDQRPVEGRDDVLVYTSGVIKRDIEVTGPVRAVLYVSTTAPDSDFTVKLVDVFPDGHARNLCDGILRLRYREGLDKVRPAKSGVVYPITVEAGVTSNVFRTGHRIRVEVSSSNFPRFDRNPNTGRPVADESELRVARQTIYHGKLRPSHVLLPVIP